MEIDAANAAYEKEHNKAIKLTEENDWLRKKVERQDILNNYVSEMENNYIKQLTKINMNITTIEEAQKSLKEFLNLAEIHQKEMKYFK